jgi:hypothetical protein
MNFIKSCFIRKNTKELRNFLEKISIHMHPNYKAFIEKYPTKENNFLFVKGGIFSNSFFGYTEEIDVAVDCEVNEKLFKAIAALRSDSDYMQYFVSEMDEHWVNQGIYISKGSFELCLIDKYPWKNAHKATTEELIEYFK